MILTRNVQSKTISAISLVAMLIFLPFLIMVTYQTAILVSRATGKKADITVDTQTKLETVNTDFFHAFSQGGEDDTDQIAPIIPAVAALKPKYIRIDHLYDHYDVVGVSDGELAFNWNRLDQAVNSILATGAKPVLALSYMPPAIAQGGVVINPPNDWNQWALVVQKTIEHYSGQRAIADIYYEVWNEPDLAQFGGWKYYGDKNYMTLYQYASEGASRATGVQRFFLGGPSTTALYKNWITALAKSPYRVDFFSWHTYSSDPKLYAKNQHDLASWLAPYPLHLFKPTLVTEFGFTGDRDSRYNSAYAMAHTAATIRQLLSGGPTYLFSFELKDGPNPDSVWGLMTHQSAGAQPKPRYYTYTFLDSMAGTRIQMTGEGTWVTGFATTRGNTLRILLVNFDKSGNHTENVPLTVTGLAAGSYSYHERFLMGRDVQFTHTVASDGVLAREIFMPAQSVAILEIQKQ